MSVPFRSAEYWDARYSGGGTSGAGSYGRLAAYKAAFINGIIEINHIQHVADFGCGDGHLLSMLRPVAYTGLDVSPTALAQCAIQFPGYVFMPFSRASDLQASDLCLSIDVIYHLIEDHVFAAYMEAVFSRATRLVLIYASDVDLDWPAPHVRHRHFTKHVATHFPEWRLCAHLPSPYPFDPSAPDETSFSDFFVYARHGTEFLLRFPG